MIDKVYKNHYVACQWNINLHAKIATLFSLDERVLLLNLSTVDTKLNIAQMLVVGSIRRKIKCLARRFVLDIELKINGKLIDLPKVRQTILVVNTLVVYGMKYLNATITLVQSVVCRIVSLFTTKITIKPIIFCRISPHFAALATLTNTGATLLFQRVLFEGGDAL